jgi:hypothetical protein
MGLLKIDVCDPEHCGCGGDNTWAIHSWGRWIDRGEVKVRECKVAGCECEQRVSKVLYDRLGDILYGKEKD